MDVTRRRLFGLMAAAPAAVVGSVTAVSYSGGYISRPPMRYVAGLIPTDYAASGGGTNMRTVLSSSVETLTLNLDTSAFCRAMDDALASMQVIDSEEDEAPTMDEGAGI